MNSYEEAMTEHYRRIRTDPMYRMLEQMEDMRVDMMPGQWLTEETPKVQEAKELEWSKRQWSYVKQLKAQVLFLSNKINEMRAKASKRKPMDNSKLTNIYKGAVTGNENEL